MITGLGIYHCKSLQVMSSLNLLSLIYNKASYLFYIYRTYAKPNERSGNSWITTTQESGFQLHLA